MPISRDLDVAKGGEVELPNFFAAFYDTYLGPWTRMQQYLLKRRITAATDPKIQNEAKIAALKELREQNRIAEDLLRSISTENVAERQARARKFAAKKTAEAVIFASELKLRGSVEVARIQAEQHESSSVREAETARQQIAAEARLAESPSPMATKRTTAAINTALAAKGSNPSNAGNRLGGFIVGIVSGEKQTAAQMNALIRSTTEAIQRDPNLSAPQKEEMLNAFSARAGQAIPAPTLDTLPAPTRVPVRPRQVLPPTRPGAPTQGPGTQPSQVPGQGLEVTDETGETVETQQLGQTTTDDAGLGTGVVSPKDRWAVLFEDIDADRELARGFFEDVSRQKVGEDLFRPGSVDPNPLQGQIDRLSRLSPEGRRQAMDRINAALAVPRAAAGTTEERALQAEPQLFLAPGTELPAGPAGLTQGQIDILTSGAVDPTEFMRAAEEARDVPREDTPFMFQGEERKVDNTLDAFRQREIERNAPRNVDLPDVFGAGALPPTPEMDPNEVGRDFRGDADAAVDQPPATVFDESDILMRDWFKQDPQARSAQYTAYLANKFGGQ